MQNNVTGEIESFDELPSTREGYGEPFSIGDKVQIKGGEFRIKTFGKKFLVLEPLPGTNWIKNI
jgi:hypothetical protein